MRGPGLSPVVRTVTRAITPFILVYGLYIVAYGHLTPGGGFPGGVMMAGGFMLLVIGLGKDEAKKAMPRRVAGALDSIGATAFLALAVAGLALGGPFFLNFLQRSSPGAGHEVLNAGIIPLANAAIALKVVACFAAVFVILAASRITSDGGFESDEED